MASKLGPLAVVLAVVLGACTRVQLTGDYTPRHVPELAPEIPVVVRNVAVQDILTGKHVEPGSAYRLSLHEERVIRQEIKSAIQRDLYTGGPFREPSADEQPYYLDVWIHSMDMHPRRSYAAMTVIGTVLLGVPFLFGVPTSRTEQSAHATFQLHAPNGDLVLERTEEYERSFARGLYYGHARRPFGVAAAPAVEQFKRDTAAARTSVLARTSVQATYSPDVGMLAGLSLEECRPPPEDVPDKPAGKSREPAEDDADLRATPQPNTIVLSIGIDAYFDAPLAIGAEYDARTFDRVFADVFQVPDERRRRLLTYDASRREIDQALEWLATTAGPDARVIVYFSGHGTTDPVTGQHTLVPFDAVLGDLARTTIPLVQLERQLAALPVKEVLLIVEAGFSGQGRRSIVAPGADPVVRVMPPARVIRLTAATVGQSVAADRRGGVFTRSLVIGFGLGGADMNHDGQVTLAEQQAFTSGAVRWLGTDLDPTQTPTFAAASRALPCDLVLGEVYPVAHEPERAGGR